MNASENQSSAEAFQQHPERPWIISGGAFLALLAGYINVVMLGFFKVPVSHMSGAVSQLGIDIAALDQHDLLLVGSIVLGFFAGAFLSGLLIGNTHFKMTRRYGVALMLQGVLLSIASIAAQSDSNLSVTLAATACGLQNAMASSYRGLILRTTHVTGIVTDLGALLGNRWRDRSIQSWKFGLLLSLLLGFFIGGLLGALSYKALGMTALTLAALASFVAGCAVWLRLQWLRAGKL